MHPPHAQRRCFLPVVVVSQGPHTLLLMQQGLLCAAVPAHVSQPGPAQQPAASQQLTLLLMCCLDLSFRDQHLLLCQSVMLQLLNLSSLLPLLLPELRQSACVRGPLCSWAVVPALQQP
jgi:hypothetical protein